MEPDLIWTPTTSQPVWKVTLIDDRSCIAAIGANGSEEPFAVKLCGQQQEIQPFWSEGVIDSVVLASDKTVYLISSNHRLEHAFPFETSHKDRHDPIFSPLQADLQSLAITSDGDYLLVGCGTQLESYAIELQRRVRVAAILPPAASGFCTHPDSNLVALLDRSNVMFVDIASGSFLVYPLQIQLPGIGICCRFSESGRILAVIYQDKQELHLVTYDVSSAKLISKRSLPSNTRANAAYSDRRRLFGLRHPASILSIDSKRFFIATPTFTGFVDVNTDSFDPISQLNEETCLCADLHRDTCFLAMGTYSHGIVMADLADFVGREGNDALRFSNELRTHYPPLLSIKDLLDVQVTDGVSFY